jgi:hypothetical protein
VSVSLHVLVILALTLWTVRDRKPERPTLDLSFATPVIVEDERPDPGVTVVPEKVEEPEPEPEVVKSEDPPVEEVAAAPPQVETVEVAPGQATQVEATAPAIGTLLDGREEGRRDGLLAAFGGSDKTEAAVALALQWLVRQQDKRDGLWSLQGPFVDGAPQDNRLAATALALLAAGLAIAAQPPTRGRQLRHRAHAYAAGALRTRAGHDRALRTLRDDPQADLRAGRPAGTGLRRCRAGAGGRLAVRAGEGGRHVGDGLVRHGAQERPDGGARRARPLPPSPGFSTASPWMAAHATATCATRPTLRPGR